MLEEEIARIRERVGRNTTSDGEILLLRAFDASERRTREALELAEAHRRRADALLEKAEQPGADALRRRVEQLETALSQALDEVAEHERVRGEVAAEIRAEEVLLRTGCGGKLVRWAEQLEGMAPDLPPFHELFDEDQAREVSEALVVIWATIPAEREVRDWLMLQVEALRRKIPPPEVSEDRR